MFTRKELKEMTLEQLKSICAEMGITHFSKSITKENLIDLILNFNANTRINPEKGDDVPKSARVKRIHEQNKER